MARGSSKKSIYSPRYEKFLEMLRAARIAAGLSQREAAEKLERPQSYIWKSERNERRVDAIELLEFLAAYGVDPAEFLKRL